MTSISDMSREDLLTMIQNTVRDEIQIVVKQEVSDRLDRFEQQLTQLSALQQQMGDITAAIDFTSKKLEDLKSSNLPALYNHVERIAEALAMQTLDLDMHRRKWSLIRPLYTGLRPSCHLCATIKMVRTLSGRQNPESSVSV